MRLKTRIEILFYKIATIFTLHRINQELIFYNREDDPHNTNLPTHHHSPKVNKLICTIFLAIYYLVTIIVYRIWLRKKLLAEEIKLRTQHRTAVNLASVVSFIVRPLHRHWHVNL
jgi:hypothetical protein